MAMYSIAFKNMADKAAPSGMKYIATPKMAFEVNVTIDDKIFKQIKSDGILLEDMKEAVDKVYEQTCGSIKGRYAAFDKLFVSWMDSGVDKKEIEKHLAGLNKAIANDVAVGEAAAEMAVESVWKGFLKNKKEYAKYKIKIGVKITGAVAGLAAGITLTATSAFTGGASFAFAIIGMVKSSVTLVREIRSAYADIGTAQKRLEDDLGKIKKADGKAAVRANEYSAAVLKQFLDLSQPSIKSCMSQMEVIEKKLVGIEVKTHEASKILNSMLDNKDKLKQDFMTGVKDRYRKMIGTVPDGRIKDIEKALDVTLSDAERKIDEQITHVMTMHERFKEVEKSVEALKKRVEPFAALRTMDVKVFENLIQVVDIPLTMLQGNVISAKWAEIGSGLVSLGAAVAYDKISAKALEGTLLV